MTGSRILLSGGPEKTGREGIIRYLMQMAHEIKKMAEDAFVTSIALLFEMAADEASDFLDRNDLRRMNKIMLSVGLFAVAAFSMIAVAG